MKRFKDLVKDLPKRNSWEKSPLSFASSFTENRKGKKSWKDSPLPSFKSAFSEHDNRQLKEFVNEALKDLFKKNKPWDEKFDSDEERGIDVNEHGVNFNSIHKHPDVRARSLEPHHYESIIRYCSIGPNNAQYGHGSSANINGMLRNMSGDKKSKIINDHDPEKVLNSIKALSSAFTPDNTNRKELKTWGGVPAHIGEHLMESNSNGTNHHNIPGFTSTSTSRSVALGFSRAYNRRKSSTRGGPVHVIQYHIKPDAGLSVAEHSKFPENEVILHHGAHIEYHGHEIIQHKPNPDSDKSETIILHHVTVHPEHKKLEEYGSYDHPKTNNQY